MIRRVRAPLVLVVLAALAFAVTAAWAGFPNFQRYKEPVLVYGDSGTGALSLASTTSSSTSSSTSGLGDPRIRVDGIVVVGISEGAFTRLNAQYEAVYVCVNGGSNVPSAANKMTLVGELEASSAFPAARNGKAQGSLLTDPLPSAAQAAARSGFACPSGQVLEFDQVIFSGLVLSVDGGEVVELGTRLVSLSVHGLS